MVSSTRFSWSRFCDAEKWSTHVYPGSKFVVLLVGRGVEQITPSFTPQMMGPQWLAGDADQLLVGLLLQATCEQVLSFEFLNWQVRVLGGGFFK